MAREDRRRLAILLVSGSEQFNIVAKNMLPSGQVSVIEIKKSASTARRAMLEREYDIILVNAPLSDELGVNFALDMAEHHTAGIMLAVPSEISNDVSDHLIDLGPIVISKPINKNDMKKVIRHLFAVQNQFYQMKRELAAKEEKIDEIRIINKAKWRLIDIRKMSEDEAHRYIGKYAMDNGLTKRKAATIILEDLEE